MPTMVKRLFYLGCGAIFVIFSVPYLNMALIQLTAESTELMLEFCGLGNYIEK